MALITVQRSPNRSCLCDSPGQVEVFSRPRLQKRDSFLMVQGSALLIPAADPVPKDLSNQLPNTIKAGALQQHLETMCDLLRQDDTIKLAVRLESIRPHRFRYFLIVSNSESLSSTEIVILGVDITDRSSDRDCTIGMVFPIWSDTHVYLDGDGGFSVTSGCRTCIFKPFNVQSMWTVLQALHKACGEASQLNHYPGGNGFVWASYYTDRIQSDQKCINEWNAMSDLLSMRSESPESNCTPTDRDHTERQIQAELRVIMVDMDFENVTSKEIRTALEAHMNQDLKEYKGFVDNEMLLVVAQMDNPSKIFDYLYLGSEWNASNLEELERNGVGFILNMTREIDNFFPDRFEYLNIRVYDEEVTDLLSHWEHTYRFISTARAQSSKCLVHCKMGVSRSASTVMAYAMKEYDWDLEEAFAHVKEQRRVAKPNSGFLSQLRTYQGILNASKQRHNYLWRSCSETDLAEIFEDAPEDQGPRRSQDDLETGTRRLGQLLRSPRPDSPSAYPPMPDSPSASPPRPDSPSAYPPRPVSPSAYPPRPDSAYPPRPDSPSTYPPMPDSPSASPPRPESPSAYLPRPDSPSACLFKPLREPLSEICSLPASQLPTGSIQEVPGSEASSGLAEGEKQEPGLRVPQPLTPSLRERIDLLTLMWQVKEMERLKEASDRASGSPQACERARAWRRRAYSVQIPGAGGPDSDWNTWSSLDVKEVPSWPRSPGARPRRDHRRPEKGGSHLRHCEAVDLAEEDEEDQPAVSGVKGQRGGPPALDGGLPWKPEPRAASGPGQESPARDEGGGGGSGSSRGEGVEGRGVATPQRPPFQHRGSVVALQKAGLVSRWGKGLAGRDGGREGVQGVEEAEDTPPL